MTAALLALGSAMAYAVSTVIGHRAATSALTGDGPGWARAGRLLRRPGFVLGQTLGALGLVLHAAALAAGLVVVVQPILCVGLVLALALGALADRRHRDRPLPGRGQWWAAGMVVAGLVVFLTSAAPTAGTGSAVGWALPVTVGAFAAGSAAVGSAVHRGRLRRPAAALAACSGLAFGLTGVLLKAVLSLPVTAWPLAWPVYALAGVGLAGTALAQWSYAAGPLVQSQPMASALEPVVAVALAGPVFAEGVAGGPVAHLAQLTGLVLLVVGVIGVGRFAGDRDVPAGGGDPPEDDDPADGDPVLPVRAPLLAAHG
ncbi:DMT family transporter [Klenkia sp. PcliD-1-E]|uniref:DMT family transporter n=1 Tax=Klenkia sp. PcliD-1-E TaxID=2954492 RepID=UPI0020970859|nr:DMT family transporter [Klenkia sp. PcliD-1-E]MCO7218398.1 DMT family transporter [Klenkia sp. PcliD-1-E]